jgi:hypothetical protein
LTTTTKTTTDTDRLLRLDGAFLRRYKGAPLVNRPAELELHLGSDPELVRKFGHKIKKIGGRYDKCLGHKVTRYVHVPLTTGEPDDPGLELANELIKLYGVPLRRNKGKVVVIVRGHCANLEAWIEVQYVDKKSVTPAEDALGGFEAALRIALKRRIVEAVTEADLETGAEEHRKLTHRRKVERFGGLLDELEKLAGELGVEIADELDRLTAVAATLEAE